jgi:hypothetical protein
MFSVLQKTALDTRMCQTLVLVSPLMTPGSHEVRFTQPASLAEAFRTA